jgi:hypothetical protein
MKTTRLSVFAAAFVLAAGLSTPAFAQGKMEDPSFRLPPEPVETVVKVSAIEVTDGTKGFDAQTKEETAFGYSFLGRTTGSFPGSFMLSMNCTPPADRAIDGLGILPTVKPPTAITGGSWTLPVYMSTLRSTGYAGSFYGTVSKGEMVWDEAGTSATVYIVLNVDGGTEAWDGASGYATFTGNLFVDEKTQKTILTGGLAFSLTPTIE